MPDKFEQREEQLKSKLDELTGRMDNIPGHMINRYLNESNHHGWEGWSHEQLDAFVGLFEDYLLYIDNIDEV